MTEVCKNILIQYYYSTGVKREISRHWDALLSVLDEGELPRRTGSYEAEIQLSSNLKYCFANDFA